MAKDFSFDIASEFDLSTMINTIDQVKREIATRYDFQGTGAKVEFVRDKNILELEANSEIKVKAIIDVIQSKFIKSQISLKFLDLSGEITSSGMIYKKIIPLITGLDQDKAKQVTKIIRDNFAKVKSQIQGEAVRVSSPKKDELQLVMDKLRQQDFPFPISFTNYR